LFFIFIRLLGSKLGFLNSIVVLFFGVAELKLFLELGILFSFLLFLIGDQGKRSVTSVLFGVSSIHPAFPSVGSLGCHFELRSFDGEVPPEDASPLLLLD
jgi:hypothetical protein